MFVALVTANMRRTTVYLDDDLALAIRELAQRQRRTQAEVIREALSCYLRQAVRDAPTPKAPGIGAFRSGRSDVSDRTEEILRERARARRR